MLNRLSTIALLACLGSGGSCAQDANTPAAIDSERWNLLYQATSVGQYHGSFPALYNGPLSLSNQPERDVSLTTTLFFGYRITDNTQLYFDPEIAGGRGFHPCVGHGMERTTNELSRHAPHRRAILQETLNLETDCSTRVFIQRSAFHRHK